METPERHSDEWWDIVYKKKDEIEIKVTDLVNKLTKGLPKEIDDQVRLMITENYRFWR